MFKKLSKVAALIVLGTAVVLPGAASAGAIINDTFDLKAPPPAPASTKAGCYRMGETGYHWYDFCLGPDWLYPHHRICKGDACAYR